MTTSAVPRAPLAPGYDISRVLKGGWQLAGGHGDVDARTAIDDMRAFVEAGITTFDCADIYTGVEDLIGRFLRERGTTQGVQVHTKYVPDLATLGSITEADVSRAIDRSRQRLGVDALDLVQFHWWDYERPGLVETAAHLAALARTGAIRHVGVTNCNTAALSAMLAAGVPVVSHQVQYSLLDQRPAGPMARLCEAHHIGLLSYGALAGGFLSERYLGVSAPEAPTNRSLIKYQLIIEEFGGWARFQRLLSLLAEVAARHRTTISAVAVAWVLAQPRVAGVIVGARHAGHLAETVAASTLALDGHALTAIAAFLAEGAPLAGDVYDLERVKGGRHAAIMRYNLNDLPVPGGAGPSAG